MCTSEINKQDICYIRDVHQRNGYRFGPTLISSYYNVKKEGCGHSCLPGHSYQENGSRTSDLHQMLLHPSLYSSIQQTKDGRFRFQNRFTLIFSHFGIGIGIKLLRNAEIGIKIAWNRNHPSLHMCATVAIQLLLESKSESESSLFNRLESESESESKVSLESESRLSRNRPSLQQTEVFSVLGSDSKESKYFL